MISEHARLEAYLRDLRCQLDQNVGIHPDHYDSFRRQVQATCQCGRCALLRQRPFENYQPQPDTAERARRQVQAIPFALPEKRDE